MKKILIVLGLVVSMPILSSFSIKESNSFEISTVYKSEFCEGWEDGYCEGWKDVKGQYAICPITPICPIPEIGQDNYRGGYNRGFKAGSRAAYRN
jgi:hypothetical protein